MTNGQRSPEGDSSEFATQPRRCKAPPWPGRCGVILLLAAWPATARLALDRTSLTLEAGDAARLHATGAGALHWESSAPNLVEVFQNGFVIGLAPGRARIMVRASGADDTAECLVTVQSVQPPALVQPETLQQYPDSRKFVLRGRKCFGSELNGQRAFSPEERRLIRSNRVINPKPLRPDKPLEWEVEAGTPIYDGAGVLMGTVAPRLLVRERRVTSSMFNFGMSKLLHGRLCLYAFSVSLTPSAAVQKLLDPGQSTQRTVLTSAWLPLDYVLEKEALLERIGLGKPPLPALPLQERGCRITGGNPQRYRTPYGELRIVPNVASPAVPSHYLRRPSGTVNLVYSVPGFGLGGQGLDSFLISDHLEFFPAPGAKVFVQPTYYPAGHPLAGKVSPLTETFIYGAVKLPGAQPVYGWMAKEAMTPK
jgi:hypothetical protein